VHIFKKHNNLALISLKYAHEKQEEILHRHSAAQRHSCDLPVQAYTFVWLKPVAKAPESTQFF
jgi:hypothetical protein